MQRQLEDALSASQSQADVDALRRRIAELEKQQSIDQASMGDLRKQLDASSRAGTALEAQAKVDQATIEDLRRQLDELLKRQVANNDADLKRLADLQEVNDTLLRFARERAFQEDVKRPLVKVALDLWGGDTKNHSEADMEAARFDEGVARIYPRMKAFETVCDKARIKFPIDHILASKTELSQEAVTYAFGPDFVAKHHVAGHYKNPATA